MQHSYVIRGFIVHAHRDPGNSRQFKGVSTLFAQGSIPTGEK